MKSLSFLLIAVLIAIAVSFSSCTEDDPLIPDVDAREKFLGTWGVEESCVRLEYEVEITAASGSDTKVFIENFAFTGPGYDPAYGYVSGNSVDLPQQTIGDNWKVSGSGTYQSDGTIMWNYYIEIGANASNCEAEYQ